MASLEGKVIAITGAASGIGYTFAKLAGSRGAKIAICDIQEETLQKVKAEFESLDYEIME
jgi:NADP-dependent 3-hydroxy acid dehydrogenase YdfG